MKISCFRLILLRRMFSLTGTVFLLRCITMLITSLSVPGVHLECTSQVNCEVRKVFSLIFIIVDFFQSYGDVYAKMRQAFRIWYGMGMSLRGVRTCGDYMFSGHTTAVTLLNHFVTECEYNFFQNDSFFISSSNIILSFKP